MIHRRFGKRKGLTLIELVLAIAITAILVSCVGTLINSAIRVRQLARTREELLQASLRIHNALVSELSSAAEATVYTSPTISSYSWPNEEYMIYVSNSNGLLYRRSNSTASAMLPNNANGFNFYNGAKLADEKNASGVVINPALSFKIIGVPDFKFIGDSSPQTCYRCLQITTTLTKNDRYYTHTSTVRLNELSLYAKGSYSGEIYVGTSSTSRTTATASDTSTTYGAVRYKNKRST